MKTLKVGYKLELNKLFSKRIWDALKSLEHLC